MLVWLVSIADNILGAIFTFIGFFVLIWTFTMAGILQDQDGKVLYCESSDTGGESCYMKEFGIVN